MAKKRAARINTKKKARGVARQGNSAMARVSTDLSDAEEDLFSHMEQGWRLETDSLGGNPVLRDPKSDDVIRPISANRSTVEALEKLGLIVRGDGREPLTIVWQLKATKE